MKNFFNTKSEIVARNLLGLIIVRKIKNIKLKAKIVETEAYFDENDPASRARQNGDLRNTMLMPPGTILVYGVHNNWLVNFVAEKKNKAGAVLIRAVEPINFNKKCNGPGLLTRALKIDKAFHKKDILSNKEFWIEDFNDNKKDIDNNLDSNQQAKKDSHHKNNSLLTNKKNFEITKSFRIGVKKDLPRKLRFYIKDNKFISRK